MEYLFTDIFREFKQISLYIVKMLQYQKMKRIVEKKEKVHRHRPILRPVVGPCAAASLFRSIVSVSFLLLRASMTYKLRRDVLNKLMTLMNKK